MATAKSVVKETTTVLALAPFLRRPLFCGYPHFFKRAVMETEYRRCQNQTNGKPWVQ
jgi:hypothetical protein